ncbi:SRPBCC family protein [Phytoactinopolyspora mesophila]|uniref:Polyketide cyclase / dehydrase and lipid transport family protein n=1 Tax=Phytoactinopolyspora mesophila TaxID=2650750 RepID=A0A7K3M3M8_9ACTN|nr:SRPBCC family protein [Phytoactinopolyspora mesophila]NDL57909.1 polyketide cyclase / dehydrase and lipid transport family protein [Phytoactinopolyspora mesophila]
MSNKASTAQDQPPIPGDRRGTLGVGPDGEWQIRFERRLRHAPGRVWAALTDPDQQAQWVPGVTIEATVGGKVVFDFGDEGMAEGEVLAVEPPRALEHTWIWPGEPRSVVRWDISVDGDETVLVMLHRQLRQAPAVDYATGWHAMLDAFGIYLDGGDPAAAEPDYAGLFEFYSQAAQDQTK